MQGPLSLDQLATISGEKPRTIRSWIRQGLLPPARGGGRGSYYDQEHVDRLLFVVKLREKAGARLPTSVVRDVLHQLLRSADPNVVRRVAHGEESLEIADLFGAPSSSADLIAVDPMVSRSMHDTSPDLGADDEVDDEADDEVDDKADDDVFDVQEMRMASPSVLPWHSEPRWTTMQLREDLELRLASDDPERVAWLARIARRVRQLLEQESEP